MNASLAGLAASGPVPVFVVPGFGAREVVHELRVHTAARWHQTPGPASILLVAGLVPDALAAPLARIHDSMAHPRATVLLPGARLPAALTEPLMDAVAATGDPQVALDQTYRELLLGRHGSEAAILPDVDPAPWRGVGPYGQGGTGMTGGVPFGRPMAEVGTDPDGLRLDVLPVAVGPLFPRFPTGLVLDVRWAGDLVLDALISNTLTPDVDVPVRPGLAPFLRALHEPVRVEELELARAREHLRAIADTLIAQGLPALAVRAMRLASTIRPGNTGRVRGLARLIERSQLYRWSVPRSPTFERDRLAGLGLGPVARAAGLPEDLRAEDRTYGKLGFEPLSLQGGDAGSRLRLRLSETVQSLELASRAGAVMTTPSGRIESPRGRIEPDSGPADRLLPLVGDAIRETEWGDAVATVVSLDLDLEESAALHHEHARRVTA